MGYEKQANGIVYEGEFDNGFKHGEGIIIFPDGSKYEGSFMKNQLCGNYGKMVKSNGKIYEG